MEVPSRYLEDASGFRGRAERFYIPGSEAEVRSILREAERECAPVTVAGGGTGVTGGGVPLGGWVLSTGKLDRIEIRAGSAVAGAGVTLQALHQAAAGTGQFYPPDPTETSATVGGTIATNASGSRSFRYGSTKRHVLRLRVALAGGRLLSVARGDRIDFDVPAVPLPAATKNTAGLLLVPGMDWIDLFAGSEGVLGVITEAELRLLPQPGSLLAGVLFFPDDEPALAAVDAWRSVPGLRMLEYFDRGSLSLLRTRFPEVPALAGAALLVEQEPEGSEEEETDRWLARSEEAGADPEASWFASAAPDRERFRVFRHALPEAVNDTVRRNGFLKLGSDYAVPLDRNREMLAHYRERLQAEFPGRYAVFGHIGDAHVHVNILPGTPGEFERGRELMTAFARRAVALGGTVSAEHGLGKRKAGLLRVQYSAETIEAMRAVKRRLDPGWLLGRGTLFP